MKSKRKVVEGTWKCQHGLSYLGGFLGASSRWDTGASERDVLSVDYGRGQVLEGGQVERGDP